MAGLLGLPAGLLITGLPGLGAGLLICGLGLGAGLLMPGLGIGFPMWGRGGLCTGGLLM